MEKRMNRSHGTKRIESRLVTRGIEVAIIVIDFHHQELHLVSVVTLTQPSVCVE